MDSSSLSARGCLELGKPLRIDWSYGDEIEAQQYHPDTNPNGKIGLFVAENVLGWPKIRERLSNITSVHNIDDWAFKYTDVSGSSYFKSMLSNFLQDYVSDKISLDQNCFFLSSGATAILELLSWALGDPNDVVAIPAPAYPVYTKDIGIKAKLERYDIHTNILKEKNFGIYPLQVDDLQKTKENIESQGKNLRMIILTQPDNPTGAIYTKNQLESFSVWAMENKIHLIVNEIYIFSRIDINHPDIKEDYGDVSNSFQSFLPIVETENNPYLHWVYSFSKDFGISGWRTGVLYSKNKILLEALGIVGCPHQISNQTQWTLGKLLEDKDWISSYIHFMQEKLTIAYVEVVNMLKELEIPYSTSRGSLFVWLNISSYLSDISLDEEMKIWLKIYEDTGCLLTGPGSFGNKEIGWLRVVITCIEYDELKEAVSRLKTWFLKHKN